MRKGYRETKTHVYFWNSSLSNFHKMSIEIEGDKGEKFPTSEHLFMYYKALHFNDLDAAERITRVKPPAFAKDIGRAVRNYNDEEWDNVRYQYMVDTLRRKYANPSKERDFLVGTHPKILVEGSPYDKVWGVGIHYKDRRIVDVRNWEGDNLLGKALMEVRKEVLDNLTVTW